MSQSVNPPKVDQGTGGTSAWKVDGSTATQPVSAASLPLPTGASTSAKQDTGNTSVASIDGKVPALGQALAAASTPVVLTAAQVTTLTPPAAITGFATETTLDARTGSLTEAAPATDTASSGLNGRLQRIAQRLTSLIALLPGSLGQKAKAASLAVTLASDQDALPITDNAGSLTVDNAGTFGVQESGAALTALQLLDDTVATTAAAIPTKGVAVSGTDGTNARVIKTDAAGELQVDVLTLPALVAGTANIGDVDVLTVPAPLSTAGGGTEATALRVTLASDSTGLVSVDDNAGSLTVDAPVGTPVFVRLSDGAAAITTLPVSAASLPLATGAATEAKQDTGNTSLGSIDTKTPALGQALAAASTPVVLTAAQVTTLTPPAAITNFANETGGNLAAATTALQIMDDWDEVDRAKVNPIVGQAGVAAGAGAVGVTVQRTTLASDDPAVVALQILDNAIAGNEMQVDVITVPAPLSTTGGGLEVDALRVTIANDSTGLVSVDDNGGSLTVDNAGTFAIQESGTSLTHLANVLNYMQARDAEIQRAILTELRVMNAVLQSGLSVREDLDRMRDDFYYNSAIN